jgi:outer membrane protein OmpA-like peptidoglycan-associated protein
VHSDRNGPEGAVLTLSRNRAKAIAAYLTTKGVARERVIAVGAGWKCYIGDSTPEFQMRNRRVEFIRKRD